MRNKRQERILEIISTRNVSKQQDLVDILRKEGFDVTQATVSRDIKQLHLGKISSKKGETVRYIKKEIKDDEKNKYVRILKDAYINLSLAQSILVIKTVSGMAMAAAAAIDHMNIPSIIGCIAGDDTIFCAVKTDEEAIIVGEEIKKLISE